MSTCVCVCLACVLRGNVWAHPDLHVRKEVSKAGSLNVWTEIQRKKVRRGQKIMDGGSEERLANSQAGGWRGVAGWPASAFAGRVESAGGAERGG